MAAITTGPAKSPRQLFLALFTIPPVVIDHRLGASSRPCLPTDGVAGVEFTVGWPGSTSRLINSPVKALPTTPALFDQLFDADRTFREQFASAVYVHARGPDAGVADMETNYTPPRTILRLSLIHI